MKNIIKLLSWLFTLGFVLLIAAVFFVYSILVPSLPSIDNLEEAQLQVPLRVYDKNDQLLAEFGEHRRTPVDFDKIPTHVVNAFLAAEDDQFWEHVGVDPLALLAAAYELVVTGNKTRGGSTITMQVARNFFLSSEKTYTRKINEILLALKIEGELDKEKILELYLNKIYLGHRSYGIVAASRVYYNKPLQDLTVAQAAMIAGLPKAPSKYNPIINPERALLRRNHILARMHSLEYLDDATYDIARAEPVSAELHVKRTIEGSQYISELIRAELFEQYGEDIYKNGLNAYTSIDGNLQEVANRSLRHALLDYTRRHGYRGVIGSIDLKAIIEDPFDEDIISDQRIGGLRKGVVLAINELSATVLVSDYEKIELPFENGIDWAAPYINVDKQGKKPAEVADVLAVGNVIWLEKRDEQWLLADIPRIEGAVVSLDSSNGAVQAMVGGFDYYKNKFNRVTQAKRQPGSNFKPFIYSAALENGFTAASIINDAPVVFDDDSLESTWRPENYSGKVYGPTRLREALVKSRNLVSIRLLQSIGLRYATQYIQRFGFKKEDMPYDLSLALGSGAFSPLEIARAYTVFSNGGYLVKPYILSRVETGEGDLLYQHQPLTVCQGCDVENLDQLDSKLLENDLIGQANGTPMKIAADDNSTVAVAAGTGVSGPLYAPRVISAQNAYIMRSMMREVVIRGTAVRAKALGRKDIGGKTGTTNDQVDAWFSGFNDQIVTTAWVGFDNQQTLGNRETGGRAALPVWIEYMRSALDGRPENLEEQPEGLVAVRIDAMTGKRAQPGSVRSRFEVFRLENAPEEIEISGSSDANSGNTLMRASETEEEIVEDIF